MYKIYYSRKVFALLNDHPSYHLLRKVFSKFYRRHFDLVSNHNVGSKTLLWHSLSEPKFHDELVYKFRKKGKNDFSYHFK